MDRSAILRLLNEHAQEIRSRFSVEGIGLFGSAARDELRADSDIDVLVAFDGPATFEAYFGLKDYLEELFGRHVDLVTEKGLKQRARLVLERDLIRVA